ncbi:MAG: OmpA family protein [Anaerolineae bacterium]|nr:OmpA family protein [Gemmatimonadaceae bacterium]
MKTRLLLLSLTAVLSAGCASTKTPASLTEARDLYQSLSAQGAQQRANGEMLRAREAINDAEVAVTKKDNQDFVNGISQIALQTAKTAQAANMRVMSEKATDSLRTARLNRIISLTEAQRNSLAAENQLSAAEISALRDRNIQVSQTADSLRVAVSVETQRADSLRMAAEEANAKLNAALMQLRTLVVEITNLQQTSRGLVISLSDILFDVDKATLKAGAEANIRRIAAVLDQYPDNAIVVEGHTDAQGTDAYNQKLSEDRAASVRAGLVTGGVDPGNITSKGFGESQPVATNDTPAGRQQNRRVEVVVLGAGTVADAMKSDTTRTPPR